MVEAVAQQGDDRHVEVSRNVLGSAIVSGDGNKVYIYHYTLEQQQQQASQPQSIELGPNPYKGLAAFQVEDAGVFFGRGAQAYRLWKRLRDLHEQATTQEPPIRLLPILGPSGSGKSSLAQAGLLPELARRPLPAHNETRVVVMQPGDTPLEALAVILARIVTKDPSPVEKAAEFERVLKRKGDDGTYSGLRKITNSFPGINASPLVILVDQFEETYSLCKDLEEQGAFIDNLIEAAGSVAAHVSVILTLRTDFLSQTQQHTILNRVIGSDQSVIVPAMEEEELRQAIAEPAKRAGHSLEDATINLLIEQTKGREGALPLLQFALTRIWEGLRQGHTPAETLAEIGGVGGALAEEAQRIYEQLNEQEKDMSRRIFVGLVQLGEGTRDTRRRAKVESLMAAVDDPRQFQNVLDRFAAPGTRLITLSSIYAQEIAEVTHEALFDNWKQFKIWLDGCRDLIRQQRRIETIAEEWSQQRKLRGYLLQGRQLDDAKNFHKKYAKTFPLSRLAQELIHKSLRRRRGNHLAIASLAIVPLLAVETYLREEQVRRDYSRLSSFTEQREAVVSLVQGCFELEKLEFRALYAAGERLAGNCRSLRGYQLSEARLQSADLSGADLSGADLVRSNFSRANLNRANLDGANLYEANLDEANLGEANLSGANLGEANLGGANLGEANLSKADLHGANLGEANLGGANLGGAELSGANLNRAYLNRAYLNRAYLSGANLSHANLSGANLSKAILGEANLDEVTLREAKAHSSVAGIVGTGIGGTGITGTSRSRADLSGANLSGANLSGADLSKADLGEADLNGANLCKTALPEKINLNSNRDCKELGLE